MRQPAFFLCIFLFLTHLIQQKLNNSHFFLTFRLRVSIFFCTFVPDFVVLWTHTCANGRKIVFHAGGKCLLERGGVKDIWIAFIDVVCDSQNSSQLFEFRADNNWWMFMGCVFLCACVYAHVHIYNTCSAWISVVFLLVQALRRPMGAWGTSETSRFFCVPTSSAKWRITK